MKILIPKQEYIALKRFLIYTEQIYTDLKRVNETMNGDINIYPPHEVELITLYKHVFQLSDNMRSYDRVLLLAKFMANVSLTLDPIMMSDKILAVQLSNMSTDIVTSFISTLVSRIDECTSSEQKVFDIREYRLDDYFYVMSFEKEIRVLDQLDHVIEELDKSYLYRDIKNLIKEAASHFRKIVYVENKEDLSKEKNSKGKEKKEETKYTAELKAMTELCDCLRTWLTDTDFFQWPMHFENVNGRYSTLVDQLKIHDREGIQLDDSLVLHELEQIMQVFGEILDDRIEKTTRRTTDVVKKANVFNLTLIHGNINMQTNVSRIIDSAMNYRSKGPRSKTTESLCIRCKEYGKLIVLLNGIIKDIDKEDVRLDELRHEKCTCDKPFTKIPKKSEELS